MSKSVFFSVFWSILFVWNFYAQSWKDLAKDKRINFYDVVHYAEMQFKAEGIRPNGLGESEYNEFLRWRYLNEYKYYPTGDRTKEDPLFLKHAWEGYLHQTPGIYLRPINTTGWEELGPRTIDSITWHYSAGLGRVTDIYSLTPDTLFLTSEAGGLWKSTDGGQTWSPKSDVLIASGAHAIAVNPFNHNKMYMDVRNPGNYYSYGVYRSDDGGETWYESNFNPANVGYGGLGDDFSIFTIRCHPFIDSLIFIGTNRGLYISHDDLQTWTRIYTIFDNTSYAEIYSIAFHPTDTNTVYIVDDVWNADRSKIYISHDLGQTWNTSNQLIDGNNDPNDKALFLDTSPDCPDCVFAASDKGVWKSTDQGQNFTFLAKPNMSFYTGFAVNKNDADNMIYGYVDIMATNDGGINWQQVTHWSLGNTNGGYNSSNFMQELLHATDYVHADLHPAKYQNGSFYIGTDGFMCKSSDGGNNWEILSFGTGIRENYRLGLCQGNREVIMNGSQDNGGSYRCEDGWVEITGGDGMESVVIPLNDKAFIGSYQFGSIYRTFDGGIDVQGITPAGSDQAYWVAPLAFDPKNQMTIYSFRKGVWKSEDFGDTWTKLSADIFGSNSWDNIHNAEIARNNTQIMAVSNYEHIKKSTDGGVTFTDIQNGLPNYFIRDIAFAPHDDNVMLVTYAELFHPAEKIFISTNGGNSWQNITYNLNNIPVHSVVVDHTPEHRIYAGTELGVFYKNFNDTTWLPLQNGMPKVKIAELEINEASNELFASTWGRGLWRIKIPGRENYPEIAKINISNPPTLSMPKETMEQYVTAYINYSGSLNSVKVKYSLNSYDMAQSMNMSLVSGNRWVSDEPLPDGNAGDKIYFLVEAVGANNDTTRTYAYMYTLRPFEYCDASGSTNPTDLYITETKITDTFNNQVVLDNTTANDLYHYYDLPVTDLIAGATYQIYISSTPVWHENDYAVWIDYNHDAEFTDDERVVFAPDNDGSVQVNFTVPSSAQKNQILRMRVRLGNHGTDPQACGTAFGEVEDYAVKVVTDTISPVPHVNPLPDIQSECPINTLTPPTANDNVDGTITATTNVNLPINTPGTTTVTWTYTDAAGNTTTQTQNVIYTPIDNTVSQNGYTLTANASGTQYTYHWGDCSNGFAPVPGATEQNFTPTQDGYYAVQISNGECTVTSDCIHVTGLKNVLLTRYGISIYPNPTPNKITIRFTGKYQMADGSLFDLSGKLIEHRVLNGPEAILDMTRFAPGVYWLNLQINDNKMSIRLIKRP